MLSRFVLISVTIGFTIVSSSAFARDYPAAEPGVQETSQKGTSTGTGLETPTPPVQPTQAESLTPEVRGDIYMARKNYREAIEMYKQSLLNQAVVLNKLGIAYHQMSDLDTAKKYYEQAAKVNPDYAEAINNLGTVYYAKKDYKKAIKEYEDALKLKPDAAGMWSNLGIAYFARKKYDEAANAFQKALTLDPEIFARQSNTGVLLQERTIEERAKYHYYLAKVYAKAGLVDRSLQSMRQSIEEGFKDRKKFEEDPEFAKMRDLPEFKEIMALQPRVL